MTAIIDHISLYTLRRHSKVFFSFLLVAVILFFPTLASAQVATIDLTAERNFVYQNGVYPEIGEAILPFVVTIANPGTTTIENLEFTVALTAGASLGNVDSECIESEDSIIVLTCTIDELKANTSKIIDFFVDGPNSLGVGQGFEVIITSNDATVLEPGVVEATLADGERRIRGSNLFVHLVRNIDIDIDRNNVPDLDEAIINLPASTPIDELLARQAVVDVLFIYTPAAFQYLGAKLGSRVANILTTSNQIFRENNVAIKLNSVGIEQIPYTINDSVILDTFDALQEKTDPAFDELDNLIISSGGDLVVMMHALDTSITPQCGWATLNATGRQGDFQALHHRGRLVIALNVGPDCLGVLNLAGAFASNMGIAPSREEYPNGGTFSYSSGYGVSNRFITLGAGIGTQEFGSALALNRFSDPQGLCLSIACGVDRSDIAFGADAIHSLNKTRHLVSAITASVFNVEPSAIEDKISILDYGYDLDVVQTTVESGALVNEFTEIDVRITNNSSATLSDIDLLFAHVNAGSLVEEAQYYEVSSSLCTILGNALSVTGLVVGDAIQKFGTLNCSIDRIAPGQFLDFSYRIQIDATPPVLNTEAYYHELVTVNTIPQLESLVCIPVFMTFVDASAGSTVCSTVQSLPLTFLPQQGQPVLDEVATVTGTQLSIPYIRLDNGSLISAEFKITNFGEVRFELLSYQTLDSSLSPIVEAFFTDTGLLSLFNILVGGINYDIQVTLMPDSNPVTLGSLNIVALGSSL
ncbi:MAG: hypothetical protein COA96_06700 [SAR86 cluster bacterium]|uniref:Uncharacterized protein n=1 Tax=SAR86 cluster bacterium TaxID=2030880 RepID=A0A2A5B2F5_9GAMM|nr:MAG: hypothetical protein COA96_06700 [SAR86 cluster bacterium]